MKGRSQYLYQVFYYSPGPVDPELLGRKVPRIEKRINREVDTMGAFRYAKNVLLDRWPEGEDLIFSRPYSTELYLDFLNKEKQSEKWRWLDGDITANLIRILNHMGMNKPMQGYICENKPSLANKIWHLAPDLAKFYGVTEFKPDPEHEMPWFITDEEKQDIYAIAKKNGLWPNGPTEGNMFKQIDVSKLFDCKDFQEYILSDLPCKEECGPTVRQLWWMKLLGERDEDFVYKKHMKVGIMVREKLEIRYPYFFRNAEFLSKFPEIAHKDA